MFDCRKWDFDTVVDAIGSNEPKFECYDVSHLNNLRHFMDRGLVRAPVFVQTVFGILGGIGADPEDLMHMHRTAARLFGDRFQWSILGTGRNQLPLATIGAAMGSHVRVGLEDSLWIGPGRLAASSACGSAASKTLSSSSVPADTRMHRSSGAAPGMRTKTSRSSISASTSRARSASRAVSSSKTA